jgi:hypothetical protein
MGERIIAPILNVQHGKRYKTMMIINPYRFGVAVDATSNIFLGTVNNLWSNPANWSRGYLPLSTERARIQNTCFVDITSAVCKDLLLDNWELTVSVNQKVTVGETMLANFSTSKITNKGTITYGGSTDFMPLGVTDLTSFANTFEYSYAGSSNIKNVSYRNLTILENGSKNATGNMIIDGDLRIFSNFLCTNYTLSINGITVLISALLIKNDTLGITFGDTLYMFGSGTISNSFSATYEFKNGIAGNSGLRNFGNQTLWFTTNNQSIDRTGGNFGVSTTGSVLIANSIVLGINCDLGLTSPLYNGSNASSTLNVNGLLVILNTTTVMATGVFNYRYGSDANISYRFNGNFTVPYTDYYGLELKGTGTKTLSGTTPIKSIATQNCILELLSYTLTTSDYATFDATLISKTLAGGSNLIFGGTYTHRDKTTPYSLYSGINVECKNGFYGRNLTDKLDFDLIFSTNNQEINSSYGGFNLITKNIIVKSIKLTNSTLGGANVTADSLDGIDSSSIFENRGEYNHKSSVIPMSTGQLQTNNAANTFRYNRAGNQDVKGGTYRTIEFGGSGVKKLLGNVIINTTAGGSQSTTGTATIDLNGFTITTI